MAELPGEVADLVFCDPPFNIQRQYDTYKDNLSGVEYLQWSAYWLAQATRVLKPTGSIWICASEEYVCELKVLAEGQFLLDCGDGMVVHRSYGMRLKPRHHVIWFYTFGTASPKKLTRSHTHLLHFVKDVKKHKWNPDAVRVPSARQVLYRDKRANPEGRLPDDTWILRPADAPQAFAPDHDVQHANRVCGTYKEKRPVDNQMPEQLIGRIIRLCTDPGDLVLSPFCGSGTDAAVAKKLGRHFLTYEISPNYVLQAQLRVDSANEGDPLDGPVGQPAMQPA